MRAELMLKKITLYDEDVSTGEAIKRVLTKALREAGVLTKNSDDYEWTININANISSYKVVLNYVEDIQLHVSLFSFDKKVIIKIMRGRDNDPNNLP